MDTSIKTLSTFIAAEELEGYTKWDGTMVGINGPIYGIDFKPFNACCIMNHEVGSKW